MIVRLTTWEALQAAQVGCMRNVENIKLGRLARYGAGDRGRGDFQLHIDGAMGELAVAKALGIFWSGKGAFRGPDVGADIQVRSSDGGRSLILHTDDPDDSLFYFVRRIDHGLEFEVSEPVRGRDGKRQEYWRTDVPHPAFFCPVTPLRQRASSG